MTAGDHHAVGDDSEFDPAAQSALEARMTHRPASDVEVLLNEPVVVLASEPTSAQRAEMTRRQTLSGLFDPAADWAAALCRSRGWPALTSDATRLHRLDPTIEINAL